MKQLFLTVLALVSMVFTSCSDNPTKPKAKFDLSLVYYETGGKTLAKTSTQGVLVSASTILKLGKMEGTKSFLFNLENNSTDSLTNVMVTSSNPKFTPDTIRIGTIGSPKVNITSKPLIEITAVHGIVESGTGVKADVMKTEENSTDITISGMFAGDSFSVTYTMVVIPVYYDPKIIDTIDITTGTVVINKESCPIYTKWGNAGEYAGSRDTVFFAGDTIKNANYVLMNANTYFTCVQNPNNTQFPTLKSLDVKPNVWQNVIGSD